MIKRLLYIVLALVILPAGFSYPEVKMKFIVINPSESETKEIPIEYQLPPELKPDDVISADGLTVDYNVENDIYFLTGFIQLGPKETKVFQIDVKDVWKIPQDKLATLKDYVNEKASSLIEGPNAPMVKNVKESVIRRLDEIESSQSDNISITERVGAYQINKNKLEAVQNDIVVLEGLIKGEVPQEKTVTIVVEAKNSTTKKAELPIEYYMPTELNKEDILDSGGLDPLYDMDSSRLMLNGRVELDVGETKKYFVKVKDVWKIKQIEIDSVQSETAKIQEQLKDTDFEKLSTYIGNEIAMLLKAINESQKLEVPLKNRIANFKENLHSLDDAKNYLDRLRSFMLQFELAKSGQEGKPGSDAAKEMTMGGGKAEGKGGGVGKGIGSSIGSGRGDTAQQRGGGLKGIRGLKGIILVSKSIFKGWKPEVATTWFIILGIIGFLFVFALLFYIVSIGLSLSQKSKEVLKDTGKKT